MSNRGPTTREPTTGDGLAREPSTREIVRASIVSLEEIDARSDWARRRRGRKYLWRTAVWGATVLGPIAVAAAASRLARVQPFVAMLGALAVVVLIRRWNERTIRRFRSAASAGSLDARRALREGSEPNDSLGVLPSVDWRLLFDAIDSGDLALFEQVVDRRRTTGRNPDAFAVSVRAIALTMRGFTNEAKALLATIERSEGWDSLARSIVARADGAFVAPPPAEHTIWFDQRALRTLIAALSRPQSNSYRSQRSPDGRYAFQSWLERFCPAFVLDPPPFRVSTAEHPATWDFASEVAPARRPRPLSALGIVVVWTVGILATMLVLWRRSPLSPDQRSLEVFLPILFVGVMAATLFADQRSPNAKRRLRKLRVSLRDPSPSTPTPANATVTELAARIAEDVARDRQLDRAADVAETVVTTSFESQRIEHPVPNWPTLTTAIEHIAWANRRDRAEALLALTEKLRGEPLRALRFQTRLALALASGDRERASAIACDLPDEIELDRHSELVAHALQAITLVPTERDRVLRRIELEPLTDARLRAVAPWVLEALAAKAVPVAEP